MEDDPQDTLPTSEAVNKREQSIKHSEEATATKQDKIYLEEKEERQIPSYSAHESLSLLHQRMEKTGCR